MAKSQCKKAFPSNKIDYHCGHTTYEGNRVQLEMCITTPFIQKLLQSRQAGGRKIYIVLAPVGGRKGDLTGMG